MHHPQPVEGRRSVSGAESAPDPSDLGAAMRQVAATVVVVTSYVSGRPKYIDTVCTESSLAGAWDSFVGGRATSVGGDDPAGRDPEVAGAIAHLNCDVYRSVTVADHELIIGRVNEVSSGSGSGEPLLYLDGEYREIGGYCQ